MKSIKYLAYYAKQNVCQERKYVLAATNKIDYICEALNNIGYNVDIISASATRNKKCNYPGGLFNLNENTRLKLFYTFPWGNALQKVLSILSMKLFILFELLKVRKDETIIVYHSMGYMNEVNIAHRIRKFKLILEVEEIYSDVNGNIKTKLKEEKFFRKADSYIFPTQLLNDSIETNGKPVIYIHGTYKVETDRKCKIFNENLHTEKGNMIHCVYAGTFDPRKGGAILAAAAAEFLPSNYHIHILGLGSEKDTSSMKELVANLAKRCKCTITYDGLLSGEEYIQFIQSCDIGLSTQNPDAAFNATSFPSKILSYMANGLRVVSIRIPAIEKSAIGEYMYYYDKQTPEEIAKAIMDVNMNDAYDGRKIISELDANFTNNLKMLLEG